MESFYGITTFIGGISPPLQIRQVARLMEHDMQPVRTKPYAKEHTNNPVQKPNFRSTTSNLEYLKTFLLRMENGFVPRAEGPWFLDYATFRFPFGTFVFRRNTKVEILYQARAEGPWFVGAGRRLFVDICTIESGRDPTNYYLYFYDTVPNPSIGHIEHDSHQYAQWMLK